jgi:hypothetical protein
VRLQLSSIQLVCNRVAVSLRELVAVVHLTPSGVQGLNAPAVRLQGLHKRAVRRARLARACRPADGVCTWHGLGLMQVQGSRGMWL